MEHEPVLADRVVDLLVPVLGDGIVLDATIGRGGHARRILEAAPEATLVGLDRDPESLEASGALLSPYGQRVRLVRGDFKELQALLERLGIQKVRGVLFDLGVSSPLLDEPRRGFSFRARGPLDMRMDPSQELTAERVVNTYGERELARVVRTYGEERYATRVARAIVAARPIGDTVALAEVVANAIPAASRRTGGHPARRTFQAIRMEVNDEPGALERALPQAADVLEEGGRVVALSYHSLEDRAVKRFFVEQAAGCVCPPRFPVCTCGAQARLRILTRRPARPPRDEVERNPRASAAKLRAAQRLGVPEREPEREEG
ncbi:MAG: 16S rRNA (cytosine(1402)-N(4))-methyltransferase RsmH [Actinomycetota bacterium]